MPFWLLFDGVEPCHKSEIVEYVLAIYERGEFKFGQYLFRNHGIFDVFLPFWLLFDGVEVQNHRRVLAIHESGEFESNAIFYGYHTGQIYSCFLWLETSSYSE